MSKSKQGPRIRIVDGVGKEPTSRPTRVRVVNKLSGSKIRILPKAEQTTAAHEPRARRLDELHPDSGNISADITTRDAQLRAELLRIREAYAGVTGSSPILLERHHSQKYLGVRDRSGIDSCVIASTVNALIAFGRDEVDEDTIISAMGGRSSLTNGRAYLYQARDYLRQVGIVSETIPPTVEDNLPTLLDNLKDGGVGIIDYGHHAQLISGFDVDNGNVSLRVNDPLFDYMQRMPLEGLVSTIAATGDLHRLLIIRPPTQNTNAR